MFSHRLVCICQARAAFADVVLQYFSPKVPILRQIHREIVMALTGRPNPRPLFVQRIAKKKVILVVASAVVIICQVLSSDFMKCFCFYITNGSMDDRVMIIVFDRQGWSKATTH